MQAFYLLEEETMFDTEVPELARLKGQQGLEY